MDLNVKDQHKLAPSCEVEEAGYMVCNFLDEKSKNVDLRVNAGARTLCSLKDLLENIGEQTVL